MDAAHKDFAKRVKDSGFGEQVKEHRADLGYKPPFSSDQLAELDKHLASLVEGAQAPFEPAGEGS